MASTITKWIFITILYFIVKPKILIQGQKQIPCSFFFGDSLFDIGNNNLLVTQAKANYPPYGIDYPDGPTGRFTNGRNIADFLAQLLGFDKPIQPFATASGSDILNGVNYASGASGIRDESGSHLGDRISLSGQLINHATTISRLGQLISPPNTVNNYLNKCLYTINIGSNDYINNYLLPRFYRTSVLFTPDQYAEALIQKYTLQLRTLYNNGARKIVIIGLGFIGCIPQELANFPTNGSSCVDSINNNVQLFNNRLKPLIDNLNTNLPGAQFIYINTTSISSGDPSAIGIKTVNAPCCVVSSSNGQCGPNQVPCSDRQQFVFWDNFHPTELLNQVTATRAYKATLPSDAYPTDILHLVQQ
ncbi:hypothetical protein ACJIZ3_013309 [Penstemon smallii]|uniref:Uncharacterized protein n=1 Tax=Penstemon smallii TaxID=265156 RepID=A0ABD3UQJ9_9LAMI